MKLSQALCVALAICIVSGCAKKPDSSGFDGGDPLNLGKGRYATAGHYAPGRMWLQAANAPAESTPGSRAATPADDDEIIVVTDSVTGEVRQCGNLSGVCIAMNPWRRPLAEGSKAPVTLSKHAAELDAEAEAKAKNTPP